MLNWLLKQHTTINCLEINPLSLIFAPTAFTPDRDGLNDVFELKGDLVSELRFVVYTRTGILIFQSNQLNQAWDGTYQGNLAPDGVYYYQVEYRDIDMKYKTQNGTVTLLR